MPETDVLMVVNTLSCLEVAHTQVCDTVVATHCVLFLTTFKPGTLTDKFRLVFGMWVPPRTVTPEITMFSLTLSCSMVKYKMS